MIKKLLIANRGEIALRIIRSCKEMGILTVAVYSEADANSLHVLLADEAIKIGPSSSIKSYLNINNIISAAIITGADAIHPGYGFLSENIEFAKLCIENNIIYVGPKPNHIERMGDKSEARITAIKAGVPVVPGSKEATSDPVVALKMAEEIGYPVMIKAVSGGGGRGMRLVREPDDFEGAFKTAKSEADSAFNDDRMYIEKLIENPRHIEVQIIGDKHGNIVHLGERDCSLQRRNQKVIEEAPCGIITDELRTKLGESALKIAKHVGYESAGTIEFLLDKNGEYYFIEMNTRIQVEHPVTESVTGVDLINEMINIASGEKLSFSQEDIKINGHAIECRINAEDPFNNFRPCPGTIDSCHFPGGYGVRVDSHIYSGYTIPSYYDSMIGKVIVWGKTRQEAIVRMKRAIDELIIAGIQTNTDFHSLMLENENFTKNTIHTGLINELIDHGWLIKGENNDN